MIDSAGAGIAIEMWPISRLTPYQNNPRKNDGAVSAVAASIREFGFRQPIVVDPDGVIVCGHTRFKAAASLGMHEVPVHVANDLTDQQIRAYRVADNKAAELAEWDADLLAVELGAIDGFDFESFGFSGAELNDLLKPPPTDADPDEIPEPPAEPITKAGDLWILGNHRLLCGDSTSAEDVGRLLGDEKPFIMVTDPPYGVEYDPNWRNEADRANGKPSGARAIGLVTNDDCAEWGKAYRGFSGAVAYVWHPASAKQFDFFRTITDSGFEIRMQMIWAKQQFPIGRGHYHVQHEGCYYCVREKKDDGGAKWNGSRKETTLWQIDKPAKSETGHSTQKPVECMARPIRNHGGPNDHVYDPFLGSGTTLIAAEQLGRRCFGLEISPAYCDVIVARWEKFTGKTAHRE